MRLIPAAEIQVFERQREDLNEKKLRELADSILELGLLHPLVVAPLPKGGFRLICGGRRLEALRRLEGLPLLCGSTEFLPPDIPCLVLGEDISEYQLQKMELEENIRRQDLTWQEETRAVAKLTKLLGRAEATEEVSAAKNTSKKWASELIEKSVALERWIDDPDVAAAPSRKAAIRIAKAKANALKYANEKPSTDGPSSIELRCADLYEVLPQLENESFDFCIADPPYGLSIRGGNTRPHSYASTPAEVSAFCRSFPEIFRILSPGSFFCSFCDIDFFLEMRSAAQEAGFEVFRTPLLWVKDSEKGLVPIHDLGIRRLYELILFCWKEPLRPPQRIFSDTIITSVGALLRGAEKPPELYERLLRGFGAQRLLELFAGTAPGARAAQALQIKCLSIELDPGALELARALLIKEKPHES